MSLKSVTRPPTTSPSLASLLAPEPPPTESLAQKLIERFQSSAYQPPLVADVAARLVELSRRPFKPTEAMALLERDAFLAGRVMQVAQSPVHSGGGAVTSLAEAVTRLGQATLGPMFLAASTKMRIFRNRSYMPPMVQVQAHSTAVAHLARLASRHTTVDSQVAFTCGLLHDVGITAALMIYGDTEITAPSVSLSRPSVAASAAPSAIAPAALEPAPPAPTEWQELWPTIRPVHERATEWLCGRWKLPPMLTEAIAHHHDVRPARKPSSLAAVVALADGLAFSLGFPACDELDPEQVPAALAALGLTAAQHQALLTDASRIQAHVSSR